MGIKTAAMEQNDRMDGAFEPRLEDYWLLTGAGNFQDDEATAGAAWGVFVRSPHAFADIRGVDTASAQAAPRGTRGADRRRSPITPTRPSLVIVAVSVSRRQKDA